MRPYLLWLRSRNLFPILPWLMGIALVAILLGGQSFQVNSPWYPEDLRRVPMLELAPALMATLAGYAARSTMWQSEHLSVRPLPWLAGGLAIVLAGMPVGAVTLAAAWSPHVAARDAHISTVAVLAGGSLLIGPTIMPVMSWVAPLTVYLATIVVQVTWRGWGEEWWPIADPRVDGDDRWPFAITVLVAGVVVQAITRGNTIASCRRMTAEGS